MDNIFSPRRYCVVLASKKIVPFAYINDSDKGEFRREERAFGQICIEPVGSNK